MYSFASGTIVSARTSSPSMPGTQPVSSNISLAVSRRALTSLVVALLMIGFLVPALTSSKTGSDIFHRPNFHRDHRKAERAGRCLNLTHIQQGDRIASIGQNRKPAKSRDNLAQKFESFASKIGLLER